MKCVSLCICDCCDSRAFVHSISFNTHGYILSMRSKKKCFRAAGVGEVECCSPIRKCVSQLVVKPIDCNAASKVVGRRKHFLFESYRDEPDTWMEGRQQYVNGRGFSAAQVTGQTPGVTHCLLQVSLSCCRRLFSPCWWRT